MLREALNPTEDSRRPSAVWNSWSLYCLCDSYACLEALNFYAFRSTLQRLGFGELGAQSCRLIHLWYWCSEVCSGQLNEARRASWSLTLQTCFASWAPCAVLGQANAWEPNAQSASTKSSLWCQPGFIEKFEPSPWQPASYSLHSKLVFLAIVPCKMLWYSRSEKTKEQLNQVWIAWRLGGSRGSYGWKCWWAELFLRVRCPTGLLHPTEHPKLCSQFFKLLSDWSPSLFWFQLVGLALWQMAPSFPASV